MDLFLFGLMIFLITADQLLKIFVSTHIDLGQLHNFIPGVISLTNVPNNGAAWSILSGNILFFYVITVIAIGIIVYLLFHTKKNNLLYSLGLTLLLSGTIGNAIDRFTKQYVTDMFNLDFMNFAIFNLADIYITIGVILIAIYIIFIDKDN